jgi:hypothetical protein
MAGPLITVLLNIPWGVVLENTPKTLSKASELFDRISTSYKDLRARKHGGGAKPPSLDQRVGTLEGDVETLGSEMKSVSQLILDITEQNQGLVRRVQRNVLLLYASLGLNAVVLFALAFFLFGASTNG